MYRNTNKNQLDIYDFILPFGGHLKEDNGWVVLRGMIDGDIIDEEIPCSFPDVQHIATNDRKLA